jgi:two-component system response regulator FixJ
LRRSGIIIDAAPLERACRRISPLASRIIYVVDDDHDVRSSISFMLGTGGAEARSFADGGELLATIDALEPGCILLDVRMPGIDGFQVMAELEKRGIDWPIVVMTGHGEVPVAVRAMKLGAVDFIEKPFGEELLLASLDRAFALLQDRGEASARKRRAEERVGNLTGREREVLQGLVAGLPNKLLAQRLGISLRTVEMHRANMMDRLQVTSLAEALTLAVQAGMPMIDSVDAASEN